MIAQPPPVLPERKTRARTRPAVRAPMAHRGRRSAARIWARKPSRRMTVATFLAACVTTLMVLYLSSYASSTALLFRLSRMEEQLKRLEQDRQELRARQAALSDPSSVFVWARNRGMVAGGSLQVTDAPPGPPGQ